MAQGFHSDGGVCGRQAVSRGPWLPVAAVGKGRGCGCGVGGVAGGVGVGVRRWHLVDTFEVIVDRRGRAVLQKLCCSGYWCWRVYPFLRFLFYEFNF